MSSWLVGGASGLLVLLSPIMGPSRSTPGWWRPVLRTPVVEKRSAAIRDRRLQNEMPEVIDLICLAVWSGQTVAASFRLIAERGPTESSAVMKRLVGELDSGQPIDSVLRSLPLELGPKYQPVSRILRSSMAQGAPISETVSRLGDEAHSTRKRNLETRARQMPVLLLFPLVLFSLPALIVGAVIPLVIVSLG